MTHYLLVLSRDPYDGADVGDDCALARDLAANGQDVTFFLVQNGALQARPGARAPDLERAGAAGVRIVADELSLRERGIQPGTLRKGVTAARLDLVLDALERGDRVLWL